MHGTTKLKILGSTLLLDHMARFAWAVSGFLHPLSWWLIGFHDPVIAGNVCILFFGVLLPPLLCWGLHGAFGSRRTVARPLSVLMFWTGIFEWCSHLICYSSPITRYLRSRLVLWSPYKEVTCFLRKGIIFYQETRTFFKNFYIHLLPFFLVCELSTPFYCQFAVLNI